MAEFGIRVFLKDGSHEDYDPIGENDVTQDDDSLILHGSSCDYKHPLADVVRFSSYELIQHPSCGYHRKFYQAIDLRESRDYLAGTEQEFFGE